MPLDLRFDPKLATDVRYGVNYFDTAASYTSGNSERAIGAFVSRAGIRNKVWITTKSSKPDPPALLASLEASFERLQTDHVEMLFLHSVRNPEVINDQLRVTVERLRKEKKISFFGFSCHQGNVAELLELASKTPWIDSLMFRYNFQQYGNAELIGPSTPPPRARSASSQCRTTQVLAQPAATEPAAPAVPTKCSRRVSGRAARARRTARTRGTS